MLTYLTWWHHSVSSVLKSVEAGKLSISRYTQSDQQEDVLKLDRLVDDVYASPQRSVCALCIPDLCLM